MSVYWCADDASGKAIKDGYSGEWPLKPGAAAKVYLPEDGWTEREAASLLAMDIYADLRELRPNGGEIPWEDVPAWIKEASDFPATPAKLCVSF